MADSMSLYTTTFVIKNPDTIYDLGNKSNMYNIVYVLISNLYCDSVIVPLNNSIIQMHN